MTIQDRRAESLARIGQLNPIFRFAIETLDGVVGDPGAPISPLDGPPGPDSVAGCLFGIKDNIAIHGVAATNGSSFPVGPKAEHDAFVVDRLVRSGASPIARMNMSEWALGATNSNATFGDCANAWRPEMVSGGSSGGSAVGVALRIVDFALGTDTAGSIRIPASVNGVVGFRPTSGRFSNRGITPVSPTFDTVGPLATSVLRVAAVAQAMDTYDPLDPTSTDHERPALLARLGRPAGGLRIGIWVGSVGCDVDAALSEAVLSFAHVLEGQGARLVDVDLPDIDECSTMMLRILYHEAAAFHRPRLEAAPELFSPDVRARLEMGVDIAAADLEEAGRFREGMQLQWDAALQGIDVLACPSLITDVPTRASASDVVDVTNRLGLLTRYWSMYGGPSLSVPAGFHPESGMPVGVQLVARRWRDDVALGAGAAFESLTEWSSATPSHVNPES